MTDQVVTARGGSIADPSLVAMEPVQRSTLVDLALRDPGTTGIAARTHSTVTFYVWDQPVGIEHGAPRRFLQVGFWARFGGALYYDDPRRPGDHSATSQDWAWLAQRPHPIADAPTVYFDQPTHTRFPPRSVMPLDELRALVLEWCNTGQRPTTVEWLTVNSLRWKLTSTGELDTPQQQPVRP